MKKDSKKKVISKKKESNKAIKSKEKESKEALKLKKNMEKKIANIDNYLLGYKVQPSLNQRHPLYRAAKDVLKRLPDKVLLWFYDDVMFIVEQPRSLIHYIPWEPQQRGFLKPKLSYIIFFHDCFKLSQKALKGLVAYYIAYYYLSYRRKSKIVADKKMITEKMLEDLFETHLEGVLMEWGFSKEFETMQKET